MYKYAVFDLDETIGCFMELGILWDSLSSILGAEQDQNTFNKLCDLYPGVFRPNIFTVFSYLKHVKSRNNKVKVIIYTNNMGPKSWTTMIKNYIEHRLNAPGLFDDIICAYKIGNQIIEPGRRSHNKTIADLRRCTKATNDSTFIFIDDVLHEGMLDDSVTYLYIKPYVYHQKHSKIINSFIKSDLGRTCIGDRDVRIFKADLMREMNARKFTVAGITSRKHRVDKIVTKQILVNLEGFFNINVPKRLTRKRRKQNKHNTSKKNY